MSICIQDAVSIDTGAERNVLWNFLSSIQLLVDPDPPPETQDIRTPTQAVDI